MTRRNFELAMKKGAAGEMIIRSHLEGKGWVVYQPVTNGAHCFDMLSIKGKKTAIAIDVKAKARMNKWPATGINQGHFEEYSRFSQKHIMPFWVVFVDESTHSIYGNSIEELEKPRTVEGKDYPFVMDTKFGEKLRIWPLAAMKHIGDISSDQAEMLISLNQRNYQFAEAA